MVWPTLGSRTAKEQERELTVEVDVVVRCRGAGAAAVCRRRRRRRLESGVLGGESGVSAARVAHHAARIVVEVAAVGALQLRRVVHHLVAVDQLRVGVGVGAVRTAVQARRLAAAAAAVADSAVPHLRPRTDNSRSTVADYDDISGLRQR